MANSLQQSIPQDVDGPQSAGLGNTSMDNEVSKASSSLGKTQIPNLPTAPAQHRNTSIAVDPVALITTECITVTSAMRKHARWAKSSVSAILGGGGSTAGRGSSRFNKPDDRSPMHQRAQSQASRLGNGSIGEDDGLASRWGLRGKRGQSMQDNPLMSAFARLRSDLRGCTGIYRVFVISHLVAKLLQKFKASIRPHSFILFFK